MEKKLDLNTKIRQLTLRQKIGQLIVTGFPSEDLNEEFVQLVKEYKIGNTIFFSYNVRTEEQIKELCNRLNNLIYEQTGVLPFITIDQEGGVVTRLPKDSLNIPGAMALAQIEGYKDAYQAAYITAITLKELGINFNLAPVLDINNNAQNPVIGVRSFGNNPNLVSNLGCQMVRGYLDGGVMCSVKHFPGHGDTAVDSHLSLPCVDKSYEELEKMELIPFQNAINAGATAVTLAHILYPQLEKKEIPATMSEKIINMILRNKLGFKGLIISDCLEMNAIKEYFGTAIGAKNAIKAGVDLVFISHTAEIAKHTVIEIENAVKSGEIPMSRIDEAVFRILELKEKYASFTIPNRNETEYINRKEYIRELFNKTVCYINRDNTYRFSVGEHPIFLSCGAYRSTLASSKVAEDLHFGTYMQKEFGGCCISFEVSPNAIQISEIKEKIINMEKISSIIIGTYNGHLNRGQIELVKEVKELGIPILLISLRNPYELYEFEDELPKISAFEYTEQSFDAIKNLLSI